MRTWNKYINRQFYWECQIISAINAMYFYFGRTIKPKSTAYEELVDKHKCRKDDFKAVNIKGLYDSFGLKKTRRSRKFPIDFIGKKPVETSVIMDKTYHSVVIVERDGERIRVPNFNRKDGWFTIREFLRRRPRCACNYYYVIDKK